MIKILIVTDDAQKWFKRISDDCRITSQRTNSFSKSTTLYTNNLLAFEIRSSFPDSMRGACYSCAVFDKFINHDTEIRIRCCVKTSIIRTKNYYDEMMKNRRYSYG